MKRLKIYSATFISYTNSSKDTVSDWDGEGYPKIGETSYLSVGQDAVLIREEDLQKYQKYGQGYRDLHFVGYLLEDDDVDSTEHVSDSVAHNTEHFVEECMKDPAELIRRTTTGDQGYEYMSLTSDPLQEVYGINVCNDPEVK